MDMTTYRVMFCVAVAVTDGDWCGVGCGEKSASAVGDPRLEAGVATRVDDGIRSDK